MRIVERQAVSNEACNQFFAEHMPGDKTFKQLWHATSPRRVRIRCFRKITAVVSGKVFALAQPAALDDTSLSFILFSFDDAKGESLREFK